MRRNAQIQSGPKDSCHTGMDIPFMEAADGDIHGGCVEGGMMQ